MAERLKKDANVTKDSKKEDPEGRDKNKAQGVSSTVSVTGGHMSGENLNLGTQQGGVTINENGKGNNNEGGPRNHVKQPGEDKNKTQGVSSKVTVSGGRLSGDNLNLGTQQGGVTINKDAKGNNNEGGPK